MDPFIDLTAVTPRPGRLTCVWVRGADGRLESVWVPDREREVEPSGAAVDDAEPHPARRAG